MVRLIMGANGAGKTKQLIDLIHNAVEAENGSVVCMEPSADMTYNISYNVRLVNASVGFVASIFLTVLFAMICVPFLCFSSGGGFHFICPAFGA